MKRALRWLRWIVIGAIALGVFATAVVIGALHTAWGRDYARGRIVAALQASFPGSTIRALDGSPLGTLVLRGVVLGGRDGRPLATIDEIAVDVALRPLVHREVRVQSLAVAGVHVFVREQPPASPTPAPPSSAASEPSAWTVELPAITVEHARITTATEAVDEVTLHAAVRIPAGAGPIAASADVRGMWRGAELTAQLLATIGDAIEVPVVTAQYRGASVVATDVRVAGSEITGTMRASAPAALVRELAAFDLPGDVVVVARAREHGAVVLSATSGPARAEAWAVLDLATLSAHAVVHAIDTDLRPLTVGRASMTAAVTATRERMRGLVAVDGDVPQSAGSGLVAVDGSLAGATLVASAHTTRGYDADATAYARVLHTGDGWSLASSTVAAHGRDVEGVRDVTARIEANGVLAPTPVLAFTADVDAHGHRYLHRGTSHLTGRLVDEVVDIELGPHRLALATGHVAAGTGGTVHIDTEAITVEDVRTSIAGGSLTASARVERADRSVRGQAQVRRLPVAAVATATGTVDADVRFTRSGRGALGGKATVRGHGIAMSGHPAVDGDVTLSLAGRRVAVTATAGSASLGHARVDAIVRAPVALTDPRAWLALPRSAAEELTVVLDGIDATALGQTGRIDGQLALAGPAPSGAVHVRGVMTSAGPVDGDVSLAASEAHRDALDVHATAQTAGVPPVRVDATVALPARVFDPAAWIALGRDALVGASLATGTVHVDPELVARFGAAAPYEADLSATAEVGPGARTATIQVDAHGVRGGKLTRPVDGTLAITTGATGTRLEAKGGTGPIAVTVSASTPLTVATLDAARVKSAPIDVAITLPELAAPEVLAMFGETDVVAGSVSGAVTVTGTVTSPSAHAQLVARKLALRAGVSRQKPATLDRLEVDARYAQGRAQVTITGQEDGDTPRLLKLTAFGDAADPRGFVASIEAANFDIAPLVALAPGRLRAARGTLTAALRVRGIDPKTGSVVGQLSVRDGRFPLSPELGTLRRATLDVDVIQNRLVARFDGRLGAGGGSVKGTLTGTVTGGLPTAAHLDMTLAHVSPIGALQPVVDAVVVGDWKHAGGDQLLWTGTLAIDKGKIRVPPATGNDLLLIGAPTDMVFVDRQRVTKWTRRAPTRPWLVTRVTLGPTDVDVEDEDYRVRLSARGTLDVTVGNGLGVTGTIATTRGDVDILGKRYRIDTGVLDFDDGTIDPRLDIRIVRDLRELTLTAAIHGRASNPLPTLTSDPGGYTQGQLLSFFLGAEPGSEDSTAEQNEAVVNGSLALVSNRLTQRINKRLPIKLDAITYEPGTASSSQAVRVGLWRSKKSYLVWRQHIAARPDENPGEALWEYQFRPSFLFEATIGELSKGGDFLWRTRW